MILSLKAPADLVFFLNTWSYSISKHQTLRVHLSVTDFNTCKTERWKHSQRGQRVRQTHLVNTTVNMTTCKLTFKTFNGSQTLDMCLLDTFCLILNFSVFSRRLAQKHDFKKLHRFTGRLFINSAVCMSVCSKGLKLHWEPWETSKWHTFIHWSPWDCWWVCGTNRLWERINEKVP